MAICLFIAFVVGVWQVVDNTWEEIPFENGIVIGVLLVEGFVSFALAPYFATIAYIVPACVFLKSANEDPQTHWYYGVPSVVLGLCLVAYHQSQNPGIAPGFVGIGEDRPLLPLHRNDNNNNNYGGNDIRRND